MSLIFLTLFYISKWCIELLNPDSQATFCEKGFLKRLSQSIFLRNERPSSPQASREALLIELSYNVPIQSMVEPATPHMRIYGSGIPIPIKYRLETPKKQITYFAFYVPGKDITDRINKREFLGKGHFYLSLTILLDAEARYTYRHWIHWPSRANNAKLSEDTVREIFNEIYKAAYGQTLEWMVANNVLQKIIDHIEKNHLDQFNVNSLFFTTKEHQLKDIITEVIGEATEQPHQTHLTSQAQTFSIIPPTQIHPGMRRIILRSYSPEELKTLSPAEIRKLPFKDIVELFNTTEKIQTVDMSLLSPEVQVQLLTEQNPWRESITPDQVQQLDTRAKEIL